MTEVNRQALFNLLVEHEVDNHTANAALELLEPIFEMVERQDGNHVALCTGNEFGFEERVKVALSRATGTHVQHVHFIHQRYPTKPVWMDGGSYSDMLHDDDRWVLWEYIIEDATQNDFDDIVTHESAIADILIETFEDFAMDAFRGNLCIGGLDGHMRKPVFCYLSALMDHNATAVKRHEPLIEILADAIPIGHLKGKPDTWLVLVGDGKPEREPRTVKTYTVTEEPTAAKDEVPEPAATQPRTGPITLRYHGHSLDFDASAWAGKSLREILYSDETNSIGCKTSLVRCYVNDQLCSRAQWKTHHVRAGDIIECLTISGAKGVNPIIARFNGYEIASVDLTDSTIQEVFEMLCVEFEIEPAMDGVQALLNGEMIARTHWTRTKLKLIREDVLEFKRRV